MRWLKKVDLDRDLADLKLAARGYAQHEIPVGKFEEAERSFGPRPSEAARIIALRYLNPFRQINRRLRDLSTPILSIGTFALLYIAWEIVKGLS
jgi:hypothetical protein